MANRSFMYTTDRYQQNPADATGLSEYDNHVHPLYWLMVSCESEMIFSNVTEETDKTAVAGKFNEGKQLVINFLELLLTYDELYRTDSFRDFVEETKEILNRRKHQYAVLENFEIVELSGNNFVPDTFPELKNIRQEIKGLYAKHLNGNLSAGDIRESEFYNDFDDVCTEWGEIEHEETDWSDFWMETLYHDL
ncbi:DUF7822 domain-containing protein [Chryseobacterium gregarium]|uniref:DUF7822 domain-containing protein n=1 Tax=Chryseobacterium gregarium TaxID=456299 RepID=UPI0004800077|nr:hypothetical protein [Chryseobacterium gregarium]